MCTTCFNIKQVYILATHTQNVTVVIIRGFLYSDLLSAALILPHLVQIASHPFHLIIHQSSYRSVHIAWATSGVVK
jgi:hypothetical protein